MCVVRRIRHEYCMNGIQPLHRPMQFPDPGFWPHSVLFNVLIAWKAIRSKTFVLTPKRSCNTEKCHWKDLHRTNPSLVVVLLAADVEFCFFGRQQAGKAGVRNYHHLETAQDCSSGHLGREPSITPEGHPQLMHFLSRLQPPTH